MSDGWTNIDDLDFVPPLPDEPPPPLPDSPSPPPLPSVTDEEPPPLPSESPPVSPLPPSDSPPLSPRPPSLPPSDVNERPPLPDFSPPSSPRSPSPPQSPSSPRSLSPPVLNLEEPFSFTSAYYRRHQSSLLPISVRTDLELPVVSPVASLLSASSFEIKSPSCFEPTSPWQLAESDTRSMMSDHSDNESIEDGEIVSLPDLDSQAQMIFGDHGDTGAGSAPPPLPEQPHPLDVQHAPPLPASDPESPSKQVVESNSIIPELPQSHESPNQVNVDELSDPNGSGSSEEVSTGENVSSVLSPKPGMKRSLDDVIETSSGQKKQRRDDEIDDHDDAASSIAGAPPSIAGSIVSHQSSMQEFQILDDIQSDDDDVDDDGDDRDSDSSLDYEEIDALLDSGVADPKPREPVQEGEEPVVKDKVILVEKGLNPFEVLPEGWVVVTHNSGMPVYLHKESRVCTLSRPYFLGPGSVRKHDIPISGIPCLQYRKEIEKEKNPVATEKLSEEKEKVNTEEASGSAIDSEIEKITSQVRIESALEKTQETSVDPDAVRAYCENLFQFKTITVHRFKTWKDRRRHQHKQRKTSRPMLPSDTKLITCPIMAPDNETEDKPSRKKGFVLNPAGKSSIGILHEYMQHSMRLQPQYEFKELDNAQTPYSATVMINKMAYGTGYATSKKAAKAEAAKATLDILIPQLKKATPEEDNSDPFAVKHRDLSFFDELKIEDPRVADLCNRAGQPSPYQILLECLKRNFVGDASLKMDMKTLKRQTGEFTMTVGSHTTSVTCKNKREGKQLAAQSILQLLHPHITCWGSLLRLYGTDSHRALKQFQESITKLQSKERSNGPNLAILAKLKKEMLKLRERKAALIPIGTMKIRSAELPSPTPVSIIKL